MKIVKGKLKLCKRDVRMGNFVYSIEPDHIKVQDISMTVSHIISKRIARGQLLDMLLSEPEKYGKDLRNYAALMYNLLCTVPDAEFYNDIYGASVRCVNRHKDLYGIKDDITDEEDAKIVREEKELHAAVEEIKDKVGGPSPAE